MFNNPGEVIALAQEVKISFEERIFSKSQSWLQMSKRGTQYSSAKGPADLSTVR